MITKCLNASRAKTKEKGLEILQMYIEIEKQEVVVVSLRVLENHFCTFI